MLITQMVVWFTLQSILQYPIQEVIKPEKQEVINIKVEKQQPQKIHKEPSLDDHINNVSNKYGMDPFLIKSIIKQESNFNPECYYNGCYGLMQINKRWHIQRMKKLGVTDLNDPYGNILVGVDYLKELNTKHKDIRLTLMMYNMDHKSAMRLYKQGKLSKYAKEVLSRRDKYEKGDL